MTCDNAEIVFDPKDGPVVECHLSPPMTLSRFEIEAEAEEGLLPRIEGEDGDRYPRVLEDDWCSEWERDQGDWAAD